MLVFCFLALTIGLTGIGIMEQKMETTVVYWGYSRDDGEENGNYYGILATGAF